MHTVRRGLGGIPTVRFGSVLGHQESRGAVRFPDSGNPTVRFGVVVFPTLQFGALLKNREGYGAVRRGFQEGKNPTVRCGAVNRTDLHRNDRAAP